MIDILEEEVETGDEIRSFHNSKLEFKGNRIEGYAIVYDQISNVISDQDGTYREIVHRGALAKFIEKLKAGEKDLWALDNHNWKEPIARFSAGSLIVEDRPEGLWVSIEAPDTAAVRDLKTKVQSKLYAGMSFMVSGWKYRWERVGQELIRHIDILEIHEVSPVTKPAYSKTTVNVRSLIKEFDRENNITKNKQRLLKLKTKSLD